MTAGATAEAQPGLMLSHERPPPLTPQGGGLQEGESWGFPSLMAGFRALTRLDAEPEATAESLVYLLLFEGVWHWV